VAVCSAFFAAFFWGNFNESWPNWLVDAMPIVTILLAVIANLASVGYQVTSV
jgi:hypothetical protein